MLRGPQMQSWALRPLQVYRSPLLGMRLGYPAGHRHSCSATSCITILRSLLDDSKCLKGFCPCPTLQHLDMQQHAASNARLERGHVAGEAASSTEEPASELLGHRGNTVRHRCSCLQSRPAQDWQQLMQQAVPVLLGHILTLPGAQRSFTQYILSAEAGTASEQQLVSKHEREG